MEYIEGALRFEFAASWVVQKLDAHPAYRERIQKLSNTKAVDFVGTPDGNQLFFIEVKDFRGHRIENKARLATDELAIEIGEKVRDSVACLVGAHRTAPSGSDEWAKFAALLGNKRKPLKILVWLEEDEPPGPLSHQRKARAGIGTSIFQKKLFWLTQHVLVCNSAENPLSDVKVSNLPRLV
jgi:hypothetical protein